MSARKYELARQWFGEWRVLRLSHSAPVKYGTKLYWSCRCRCGVERAVEQTSLLNGKSKSCGHGRLPHGLVGTKVYRAWASIKTRCYDKNYPRYSDYGGRGITVCRRWRISFSNFYADVGDPPSPQHSIDRINNNGNYTPSNVRWATALEQRHNRRDYRGS
jgi:hypothetical protein